METITPNEIVVMEGTFLYDGKVECDLRIVRSAVRYGSGDYEDPPEIADDTEKTTFYIQFGSTTQRGYSTLLGKHATRSMKPCPMRRTPQGSDLQSGCVSTRRLG